MFKCGTQRLAVFVVVKPFAGSSQNLWLGKSRNVYVERSNYLFRSLWLVTLKMLNQSQH